MKRYVTKFFGAFTAFCLGALPQRSRFAAATRVARAGSFIIPLVGQRSPEAHRGGWLDPAPARIVRLLCDYMDRLGLRYTPTFVANGERYLVEASAAGQGVLLISAHFILNHLAIRWLHDLGLAPTVAANHSRNPYRAIWRDTIPGTGLASDVVAPRLKTAPGIRDRLRSGNIVLVDVDRAVPYARSVYVDVGAGKRHISMGVASIAHNYGLPVLFLATTQTGAGKLCVELVPAPRDPDRALGVFTEFLQRATKANRPWWFKP